MRLRRAHRGDYQQYLTDPNVADRPLAGRSGRDQVAGRSAYINALRTSRRKRGYTESISVGRPAPARVAWALIGASIRALRERG
jgi:hypothetical protein